jgi:hypothetical protein
MSTRRELNHRVSAALAIATRAQQVSKPARIDVFVSPSNPIMRRPAYRAFLEDLRLTARRRCVRNRQQHGLIRFRHYLAEFLICDIRSIEGASFRVAEGKVHSDRRPN